MKLMCTSSSVLWQHINKAEKLGCVLDNDTVQVAAYYGGDEVPLAELGVSAWRQRLVLAEMLALHGVASKEQYLSRFQALKGKEIFWIPES